jgi:sulfite reductase alpha subunit-like flavoprotein
VVQPVVPPIDYAAQMREQMAYERQQLAAQNEQAYQAAQAATQAAEAAKAELAALKQQVEIEQQLSQTALAELTTIDPEDAKKLLRPIMASQQQREAALRKELEAQRKFIEEAQHHQLAQTEKLRQEQLNAQILAQHPDFWEIQNTDTYKNFMAQKDGLSSKTRDQRAAEEYRAGNVGYVVDILKQVKATKPAITNIASVTPVQTGSLPVTPSTTTTAPDLHQLNQDYQMRKITHDKYLEGLAAVRKASKQS